MLTGVLAYVKGLLRRNTIDAEVDQELRFHVEMEMQANIDRGMTPAEARRVALRDLGGVTQTKEAVRQTRGGWIDAVVRDVRHAVRLLARNRRFTAAAVLTLALGIGANAAIFGIVDAALFRPIPYKDADRLVLVGRNMWAVDGQSLKSLPDFASGIDVDRMRAFTGIFEDFGAYRRAYAEALATGIDQNLRVGGFTPNFPKFLGVSPEIGRAFTRDDLQAQDAIIVSDGFWQRAFNRDPRVIGKTLAVPDHTYVVIGVMPPTFRLFGGAQTDAWLPINEKDGHYIVARLRRGLTFPQAERALKEESKRLPVLTFAERSYPFEFGIVAPDWERAAHLPAGFPERPRPRGMLLSLMAAVGFVLLIACANVANLLLVRTLARQNEIAVRRALGATRAQLARQFLIEGFVLAGLGGVVASFVAWAGIRTIPSIAPPDLIPTLLGISLPQFDLRVLAFAGLTVLVAGMSSGVASAIRASGWAADRGLLSGGRRIAGSRGQRLVRHAFQAVQIALTLVLLTGAGLFVNSFVRMVSVPAGFDSRQLASAGFDFPRKEFASGPQKVAFVNELAARVSRMRGVVGASVGEPPVLVPSDTDRLVPDGNASRAIELRTTSFWVGPEYFRVAGIGLEQGRAFTEQDRQRSEPVLILSDAAAMRLWPGRNPVGRQVGIGKDKFTVVGIVPRLRTRDLAKDSVEVYFAADQSKYMWAGLLVRTTGDADRVAAMIRAEAHAINPRVTVLGISTVDRLFAEFDPFGSSRFYAVMLSALAVLGLLTAAVGLYGLMSFAVRQRTHEIGVRIALGADPRSLRRLIAGDAIWPVSVGLAVGVLVAGWFSKFLASQLFHITPHDPVTMAAVVGVLLLVCLFSVLAPVRQATHTNPVDALREE
jgi:putative ABC transport system permease protein